LGRLEELARDKHSSLLQRFVNYGRKKFYKIGTRSDSGISDVHSFRVANLAPILPISSLPLAPKPFPPPTRRRPSAMYPMYGFVMPGV
jgi:hypothetical protein